MRRFSLILFCSILSYTAGHAVEKTHQGHEKLDQHGEELHSNEETHEEAAEISSEVGPENAVTEANREDGFKLSEAALKTLGIETTLARNQFILVPEEAIVSFQAETGVYRFRDGWFKLVEGKAERSGKSMRFSPERQEDLKPGDRVAITGVPLLRVTELDTFGGSEEGHAH